MGGRRILDGVESVDDEIVDIGYIVVERRKVTEMKGYDAFSLMLMLRERVKSDPVSSYKNEDRFEIFLSQEKICFSRDRNFLSVATPFLWQSQSATSATPDLSHSVESHDSSKVTNQSQSTLLG
jgi:hypothetical protein